MSLRILFADDSMTAQNMGKKILTDAGYDVIAVSNGAAAVKKIAEHKPDIIILDVYMPGYTGLEVCEKVRASIDTLKTPVLLTVGKLEPYRAEDANRVKADGVIIKPFEASDLIAIVKKLEERVVHKSDPVGEQTILLDRPPDFSQFQARAEAPVAAERAAAHVPDPQENKVQGTVDVPDHMAMAAVFSDLLGTEPVHNMEPFQAPNSNHAEFHVAAGPQHVETPSAFPIEPQVEEVPSGFSVEPNVEEAPAALAVEPQVEHAPIPFPVQPHAASAPPAMDFHSAAKSELKISLVHSSGPVQVEPAEETMIMPAYKEPEHDEAMAAAMEIPVQHDPGFEPAGPQEPMEAASSSDPELQPSFEEQGKAEIHASADPGLMAESSSLQAFPTKFGAENAEDVPVGVASDLPDSPETAAIYTGKETRSVNDDDFDARVAAALAAYDQAAEMEITPEPQASHEAEMPVSFEYVPPVSAPVQEKAVAEVEAVHVPEAQATAVLPVKHESEPPTAVVAPYVVAKTEAVQKETEQAIVAGIETAMPMTAAADASQAGPESQRVIADVVHRVMERFKPELIAEIVRELNLKK